MASDPMFKLEHASKDEKVITDEAPRIHKLQLMQEGKKDNFSANQILRKKFRVRHTYAYS